MIEHSHTDLSEEVANALEDGMPLVALESSVIAQGLPRPINLETALHVEEAVRTAGAVPATLAVLDGRISVGLGRSQMERLARQEGISKAGARDLGWAVSTKSNMATTVGSSIAIAAAVGIPVLATGGVGGAHRGVETTGDVSNDLQMLSKHPVVVVSSGFKSILDLPRTLEYLETLGVPITGYKTTTLPDFYGSDSGYSVPRVDHPQQVAAMLRIQQEIGLCGGIVVANPPPEDLAFNRDELGQLVQSALAAAASAGIRGKDVTPFLLSWLAGASGGRTVELNEALLISNARVAAEIAGALASA